MNVLVLRDMRPAEMWCSICLIYEKYIKAAYFLS